MPALHCGGKDGRANGDVVPDRGDDRVGVVQVGVGVGVYKEALAATALHGAAAGCLLYTSPSPRDS